MGKFSFLILAAFGYGFIVANKPCTPKVNHFSVSPQELYDADNLAYFDGQLPKVEVVAENDPYVPIERKILGLTEHTPGTHYYKIYISPVYNVYLEDEMESTLHEACHVWTQEKEEKEGLPVVGDDHGLLWQNCMKMVAARDGFSTIW